MSLIGIMVYVSKLYEENDFLLLAKITTVFAIVISFINYFSAENLYAGRSLLGIERIAGLVGEPNFTGYALSFPWLIFFFYRRWTWLLVLTIPFLWVQSRAVLFFFLILLLMEATRHLYQKALRPLQVTFFIFFFFSPFIISSIYSLSPPSTKKKLVEKVTTRFYLSKYYSQLGLEHPFGVGVNNGRAFYVKEGADFRTKVQTEAEIPWVETAEQHSLLGQILSEFGIIPYLALFIFSMFQLFKYSPISLNLLCANLSILIFTNGLTELTLYLALAFIVATHKKG